MIDNKGMAISGILYSLLILFIVLVLSILSVLIVSKFKMDKVKEEVQKDLNKKVESKIIITPDNIESTTDSVFVRVSYVSENNKNYMYEYSIDNGNIWIEIQTDNVVLEFVENGIIKARIRTGNSVIIDEEYSINNIISIDLWYNWLGG